MQCRTVQFFIDCWCDASVANAYKAIKERTLGKLCVKDLRHDEDFAMFKLHIIDLCQNGDTQLDFILIWFKINYPEPFCKICI